MPSKHRPYERFGSYLLFKKLESDALGDLFRAARIEGDTLGATVALRRLSGADREAMSRAAGQAHPLAAALSGATFVRDQRIEVISGLVAVTHEYAAGRSLRAVVTRSRAEETTAGPLPLDQALVIAERVALSLATTSELRHDGERLLHGALIPQFVWITEEGEIRVAGQHLGPGLLASLRDEKVGAEIGRYFAPETQHSGALSRSTEVYALGALLYLVVTGLEPPDATRASAFTHAVRAAKTTTGEPLPEEVRVILERSLNIDPGARFDGPAEMRAALSALTGSGRFTATSFNLAFYLSNLLKKEFETEVAEREREAKVNVAPYLVDETAPRTAPTFAGSVPRSRRKAPIAIAATLGLAVAGAAGWYSLAPKGQPSAGAPVAASMAPIPTPPAPKPLVVPEPIVASSAPADSSGDAAAGTNPADDEAARKRAFDEAVKKRLQEELLKLQSEYTRQLQQQQARNAPVLSTAPPEPAVRESEEPRVAPAETARREPPRAQLETASAVPAGQPDSSAITAPASVPPPPAVTASIPPSTQTTAPPPAAVAQVRNGDVVDMNELDQMPTPVREPRPVYPPIAARQKIEATIMASVLISETGEVLDVTILRGDPRFGFNDSAIRAFKAARYTPPVKDGKRVKTWIAQIIQFKP